MNDRDVLLADDDDDEEFPPSIRKIGMLDIVSRVLISGNGLAWNLFFYFLLFRHRRTIM